MNCPQKRCEPSCAFCLDANEPFLAAPLIFLFSYNARTGYQRSAKRECRQGLRIVRYHFFEKAGKRLSCGPAIFAKKLQKSRETYNFTAFCVFCCRKRCSRPQVCTKDQIEAQRSGFDLGAEEQGGRRMRMTSFLPWA